MSWAHIWTTWAHNFKEKVKFLLMSDFNPNVMFDQNCKNTRLHLRFTLREKNRQFNKNETRWNCSVGAEVWTESFLLFFYVDARYANSCFWRTIIDDLATLNAITITLYNKYKVGSLKDWSKMPSPFFYHHSSFPFDQSRRNENFKNKRFVYLYARIYFHVTALYV